LSRIPSHSKSYFRIEAILEAPMWALIVAIILMTIAVVSQVVTRL